MFPVDSRDVLATVLLAASTATLVVWLTMRMRRRPFTPSQWLLFGINYIIVRILWRTQLKGSFPLPPGQGGVVVCNHRCPLDPSFVEAATARVIHWMVAREYCEHPAFRRLLKTCEVIPVRRGGTDMRATRHAIRLLQQGELVGVFPEGRINTTEELLLPLRSGAAMMAIRAKVPVVPVYIEGAPYDGSTLGCLLTPAAVRVQIGPTIQLCALQQLSLADSTLHIARAIAQLAGQPGFQPEVVGRRNAAAG